MRSRRVFISVGEASGDAYGAELVTCMRERGTHFEGQAVGGKRLQATGFEMIADCSRWGALGILEAFKVGPRVLGGYMKARKNLRTGTPGLFIPIDFGFTNIKLARLAKAKGWRVLYFMPPGSWRRTKQGADLPDITDEIVTPFPWSADLLADMGASVHWFGHPLKEMIAASPDQPRDPTCLAALPGSRAHEIALNVPAIAKSLPTGVQTVEFAVAPTADVHEMERTWRTSRPDIKAIFTSGDTYGVLKRARAAVVCSGTATLEAALCGCPCTVIYLGSKMMEIEYRIRKPKFEYISLPNILLRRQVVPELIQWDATPERISTEVAGLWRDGIIRDSQLAAFAELQDLLGPGDALTRTAALAASMLADDV